MALVLDHQVICSAPYFIAPAASMSFTALFSNYSNTISSKTLPCKPSNFSASEFNLNWKDNSPDESNFVIDVSTDSGTTWVEAFLPANTQFYQVNRFFCGTRQSGYAPTADPMSAIRVTSTRLSELISLPAGSITCHGLEGRLNTQDIGL